MLTRTITVGRKKTLVATSRWLCSTNSKILVEGALMVFTDENDHYNINEGLGYKHQEQQLRVKTNTTKMSTAAFQRTSSL